MDQGREVLGCAETVEEPGRSGSFDRRMDKEPREEAVYPQGSTNLGARQRIYSNKPLGVVTGRCVSIGKGKHNLCDFLSQITPE